MPWDPPGDRQRAHIVVRGRPADFGFGEGMAGFSLSLTLLVCCLSGMGFSIRVADSRKGRTSALAGESDLAMGAIGEAVGAQ